uniref:Uncharacterized protein n=1 Tax=Mola mola TaxID=94237 RepID=A0A3Q3XAJ2_MOLML
MSASHLRGLGDSSQLSQLVLARFLPATVRHHEAGDAQSTSEAEAPHKHSVAGFPVLAGVLKHRSSAAVLLRPGHFTEGAVTAGLQCVAGVPREQPHTRKSHPERGDKMFLLQRLNKVWKEKS